MGHQRGGTAVVAPNFEQIPSQPIRGLEGEDQVEMRAVIQVEPARDTLGWFEKAACEKARRPDMKERSRRAELLLNGGGTAKSSFDPGLNLLRQESFECLLHKRWDSAIIGYWSHRGAGASRQAEQR